MTHRPGVSGRRSAAGRLVRLSARQDGAHGTRARDRPRGAGDAAPQARAGRGRHRGRPARLRRVARGTGRPAASRCARRGGPSEAQGAGESGLSRLIQMHVFNTAGDAAVAISLAGTLFFQVPSGEARGQVALFLGLTMLPFAIVAPLIGPFLDRFAHGRRWAIGATMAVRAFLCWVLAVVGRAAARPWLFPAALGVLVASKAYGVTRAAAVPRLLPPRLHPGQGQRPGVAGRASSGPPSPRRSPALASLAGPEWSLRYAFVLFVIATICAIRLPARVDSSEGEGELSLARRGQHGAARPAAHPDPGGGGVRAARQLRAAVALSGFLLMFMAFLLRDPDSDRTARAPSC